MPVIKIEPLVIFGVNLGILSLPQPYEAEGIAVVQPPVQKDEPNERPCQPVRDFYGKSNFDDPAPAKYL